MSCFVPIPVPGGRPDQVYFDAKSLKGVLRERVNRFDFLELMAFLVKTYPVLYLGKADVGKANLVHTFVMCPTIVQAAQEAFEGFRKLDGRDAEEKKEIRSQIRRERRAKTVAVLRPAQAELLAGLGPVDPLPADPSVQAVEEFRPARDTTEVCKVIVSLIRLARREGKIALAEENAIMEALVE
jgi:hypothetical protein